MASQSFQPSTQEARHRSVNSRLTHLRDESTSLPGDRPVTSAETAAEAPSSTSRRRIERVYSYLDEQGNELYQVVRYVPKDFRPRRRNAEGKLVNDLKGVRRIPYGLDRLAKSDGRVVFVCEGEKDVETAWGLGLEATCGAGGSNGWRLEFAEFLRDRHIVILPHNDEPGRKYAGKVKDSVIGIASSVVVVALPGLDEKEDLTDFVARGGTRETILVLADEAEKTAIELQRVDDAHDEPTGPHTNGHAANGTSREWVIFSERFSDIKAEPIDWLWEPIWQANAINLLTGQPGLGKTFVATHLAACVTRGLPWPDGPGKAPMGDAVFMSAEDSYASVLVPRAAAAGADLTRLHRWKKKPRITDDGKEDVSDITLNDIEMMEAAAKTMPELKLLIFDPCTSFVGKADANDNAEVREILCRLMRFAESNRVTIILITHEKKMTVEAIHSPVGSLAWTAVPRVVRGLFRDPDDKKGPMRFLLPIKNNHGDDRLGKRLEIISDHGRPASTRLRWHEGAVETSADEVKARLSKESVIAGREHSEETTDKKHQNAILDIIDRNAIENDGWVTVSLLRECTGQSGSTCNYALYRLVSEEILEQGAIDRPLPKGGVQIGGTKVYRRRRHDVNGDGVSQTD